LKTVGAYDAKTNLARLLEEVAAGETITITKHGVPIAILSPATRGRGRAEVASAALREFRARHRLGDVTIRELIDEGRER
jgi:prevent-host-death family protein